MCDCNNWLPIETAPKEPINGSYFVGPEILGINRAGEQKVICWSTEYPASKFGGTWKYGWEYSEDYIGFPLSFDPVKWQPLAAAPTQSAPRREMMFWNKKPAPPRCLSCQLHEQSLRWGNDNAEYKKQCEAEREKSARKAEKREAARLAGIEKQKSKLQKPQASEGEKI